MFDINKYITLFHSIQGITYKEKQKQLNEFLRVLKINVNHIEDYDALIKSITPKNYTEEMFKAHLMIALKRHDLLLQELKTCDRMLVNKLLKDWRLFGEIFNNVPANDLINNILPHLSYTLRLKILNGISKNVVNEELLDQYFNALKEKYGLKSAAIILPGCSLGLIRSIIEKYHIVIPPLHLKRIFKKDEKFVYFYFEKIQEKYKHFNFSQYKSELKYIAKINPNVYWELQDKYKLEIKFGKYMTPRMIKSHKDIVGKGFAALNEFHLLQMHKTLKTEGKLSQFLFSFYPETHDRFQQTVLLDSLLTFLEKGPRLQQYYLVSANFNQKYNRDLLDFPKYFTETFLKMTPIKEREIVLDYLIKTEDQLICYYGTATSVPKLKELMGHCSNSRRRMEYLDKLVNTCFLNKDKNTLIEVLEYIIDRYKNDTPLLQSLLQNMTYKFDLLKFLTEEHHTYLFTIIKILELSGTWVCGDSIFESYISRALSNQKSVEKIIHHNIQGMIAGQRHNFVIIGITTYKSYFQIYCDEIATCIDSYKDHKMYKKICTLFLYFVITSMKMKKDGILKYERFFGALDQNEWEFKYIVLQLVKCDVEIIHDLFWNTDGLAVKTELIWYARYRPDKLKNNCDKIWKLLPNRKIGTLFKQFKKFCNDDIIQKIRNNTLQAIRDEDSGKLKYPIHALSVLLPEMFMEQITTAYPDSNGKIDLEKSQDKINLQCAFVNSLKNIEDCAKSFPLVLRFCVGDYLKFALPSLYSITYNMKGLSIKESLNKFSNTAVSVRKHFLFLSRHLFPVKDFYMVLNEWSEKEKNLSMRDFILKKTTEYLVENPSEQIWLLLKDNLNKIDSVDEAIYDFLLKFQKVPVSYLPNYMEAIYYVLSNNSEAKISKKKYELANAIPTEVFDKLSHTFLQQLIKETLCCKADDAVYWKCVFYVNAQKQPTAFAEVFHRFADYVDENRFNLEDPVIRSRISKFVCDFVHNIVTLKEGGTLIEKFKSAWLSIFTRENFVNDFILIELADLYLKSAFDSYATGLKINNLLYEYITTRYNVSVIESFAQRVRDFLSIASLDGKKKELFAFVDGFFKEKRDEHIYVAVIYFLPKQIPTIENSSCEYMPIFEEIKKCKVPTVQYHLEIYLSNFKDSC